MQLKFKILNQKATLPLYAYPFDAGFDLYSAEDFILEPGKRHVFQIGLASEIPEGYFVMFKPKSGLAAKAGIDVLAGIIDSGYRGEWGVVLVNLGQESYQFKTGDKICQAIIFKLDQAHIIETEKLSEADRGQAGFGSSGK